MCVADGDRRGIPTVAMRVPRSARGLPLYNTRRPHQALASGTPMVVRREGTTGALFTCHSRHNSGKAL